MANSKEYQREYRKRYRIEHREKVLAYEKQYRETHREILNKQQRERRANNKERTLQYNINYWKRKIAEVEKEQAKKQLEKEII